MIRRLTDRDRHLIRTVARLRVLTGPQLATLYFDSPKTAANRLVTLHRLELLDRFQPYRPGWGRAPLHYVLGRVGAGVIAVERSQDFDAAYRRWRPDKAVALARAQRLAHLVGVNGVYTDLASYARRHSPARLHRWLTESDCTGWCDGLVFPDAYGEWQDSERRVEFYLEYDRGSEHLGRLTAKLVGYERLETARGVSTWVLFTFLSPRREAHARRALTGTTIPVATATLLPSAPVHTAIWLPLQPSQSTRLHLVDLATYPKPPEALRRAATSSVRAWRFDPARYDLDAEPPMEF
ncbi:MAG: replication-relaxation family protein [Mycobacteriales bacterium]